jgi:hypothetical protein
VVLQSQVAGGERTEGESDREDYQTHTRTESDREDYQTHTRTESDREDCARQRERERARAIGKTVPDFSNSRLAVSHVQVAWRRGRGREGKGRKGKGRQDKTREDHTRLLEFRHAWRSSA